MTPDTEQELARGEMHCLDCGRVIKMSEPYGMCAPCRAADECTCDDCR